MDTMNYLTLKIFRACLKIKYLGMGGALDSARFKYYLSQELDCSPADLNAVVIGGHGDTTMIPLIKACYLEQRIPVTQFLSDEQQDKDSKSNHGWRRHFNRFDRHLCLVRSGSRYCVYGGKPSYATRKNYFHAALLWMGSTVRSDISLVVPVILGKNGWEKIVDFKLSDTEQAEFNKSADAVRNMNQVLVDTGVI